MSDSREVDDVLSATLDLLDRQGISCVLLGGIAVNVWAVPRATFDVDLAVELPRDRLRGFFEAAERAGFFYDEPYAKGFTELVGGLHPLVVLKRWTGGRAVHVDLFLVETKFLRAVYDRAVSVNLAGASRRVASAADLILLKLLAWRGKDRLDIANILAIQGIPDEVYLRRSAEELGVRDRLELALSE